MSAKNNGNGSANVDFNSAVDAVMNSIDMDALLKNEKLMKGFDEFSKKRGMR